MSEQNGQAITKSDDMIEVTEVSELEVRGHKDEPIEQREKQETSKKRYTRKTGKPKTTKVVLDAGNGRCKFAIGEYFDYFTSQWAIVRKLPRDIAGAFSIDNKHYIVGDDIDCVADAIDQGSIASKGKVEALPLMLIAALTYHPDILDNAPATKKRSKDRKL